MTTRTLGPSGIRVAPFALGGNVFGWTIDETALFRVLDEFVASGFNLIDTADVYSRWAPGSQGGESETIIGRWLKKTGNRAKVVIATKVGMEIGPTEKGLSAAYIRRAVAEPPSDRHHPTCTSRTRTTSPRRSKKRSGRSGS